MRINRLFPIFCVSEVTVRNEKHRLPAAEVVKGKGRISRQAVALLSVVGLAFSSLLAVVPLSAPAANHSTQVASKSSAATSRLDFREAGSVAGAGRASGPLRAGASPSDDRFTFNGTELTGLTDKGKTALEANKELTIPAGTTKIAEGVFSGLKLTKVTLPDSVTEVADRAFYDNQITELVAPGLKTIGEGAFQKNKLVAFASDTLTAMGEGAFSDNDLKSVKIKGAPVTVIAANAFRDNQLDTVELPDTVRLVPVRLLITSSRGLRFR